MAHNVSALLLEEYGDSLPSDRLPSDVTVGTVAIQLVPANARRNRLRIVNTGGANVTVGYDFALTVATGIPIGPGQTAEYTWDDDWGDVTRRFTAIAAVGGVAVHIEEEILTGNSGPLSAT